MDQNGIDALADAIDRLLTWQEQRLADKEQARLDGFKRAYTRRRSKPPNATSAAPIAPTNEPGPVSPAINSSPRTGQTEWFYAPRRK